MRQSESIAKLAPALVKAQAEVENALKNATNPHFKNEYANLESVLAAVKPALAANGLALVQVPGFEDGHATLESMLIHESGEWISGLSGTPLQKGDPQGLGSATTYLRRYATAAIAGIAQEDDDGNGNRKSVDFITDAQAADLRSLMEEVEANESRFLMFLGVSEVGRIPKEKYSQAVSALEQKRAANGAAK